MAGNPHGYTFNHIMLRVKDPSASLGFYCGELGMTLLYKQDFDEAEFTLYFLGFVEDGESVPEGGTEAAEHAFSRMGVLELTHNWGTEDDPDASYHSGNEEPRGYGHIGIAVPDVAAACTRLEAAGADFVKRPDEGRMKGIAFVKDPDGYWIEILNPARQAGG